MDTLLRAAIGAPLSTADHARYDPAVAVARAALGNERFTTTWAEGHALTLEQAITAALQEIR